MSEVDPAAAVINGDELTDAPFYAKGADLLERTGLSGRVFFDESAKLFYLQDDFGEWRGRDRVTFSTYLKYMGYCPVVRTDKQEKIAEIEHVTAYISLACAVQFAGAIAGFNRGLIINNGQRMLVTREAKIIQPIEGEFPVLMELIHQMFGTGTPDVENAGPNQLPYFLGWWKHALHCLNDKYSDKRILAMAFAGEAGCGKSLMKEIVARSLGGRECKPYDYMIGKDNFNKDLLGAELWTMDDDQGGDTTKTSRLNFGASLKKVVADKLYKVRGICQDGVTLEMYRCLLICLNREPDRLKVLPQLDDDIEDKLSVLLAHKHAMPMPVGTPADKEAFWDTLCLELPGFMYWLLNEYEIAAPDFGRFGMTHFHHPDLVGDLFEVSHEREFWMKVNRVLKKCVFAEDNLTGSDWYWCGKAEELHDLMSDDASPLTMHEKAKLPWSIQIGKNLSTIAKSMPDRVIKKRIDKLDRWVITKDGRTVTDAVGVERARVRARNYIAQDKDEL